VSVVALMTANLQLRLTGVKESIGTRPLLTCGPDEFARTTISEESTRSKEDA
jgi:hypothetical protein